MNPKIEIDLAKVERLAAQGLTNAEIADALGISEKTFYNRKNESAEFTEAVKRGQAKGKAIVTNKLFELIQAGNLGATCFYLKCRGGWQEKLQIEAQMEANHRVFLFGDNDAELDKDKAE